MTVRSGYSDGRRGMHLSICSLPISGGMDTILLYETSNITKLWALKIHSSAAVSAQSYT